MTNNAGKKPQKILVSRNKKKNERKKNKRKEFRILPIDLFLIRYEPFS